MTLAHAPHPESPHRPGAAESLPFRISSEMRGFPIGTIVQAERIDTPPQNVAETPAHITPDTPNGRVMPEHQSNIGHAAPDVDRVRRNDAIIARDMRRSSEEYMDFIRNGGQAQHIPPAAPSRPDIFNGRSDEEVLRLYEANRQSRMSSGEAPYETPLARVRTPYEESKRPSAEEAFRQDAA